MRTSAYPRQVESKGVLLPLAFIYDDTAYYFDVDGFDDAMTTCALVSNGKDKIAGEEANRMLRDAIASYAEVRDKVWMAKWFRDCVACEIAEQTEQKEKSDKNDNA